MARRRYQKGSIRKRGKRHPVWELQWWEDFVKADGTIGRRRESAILGYASDITVKQARREAEKKLSPLNAGNAVPYSTLTLQEFVDQFFLPLAFPILKSSTRKRYRSTLDLHLLPALGKCRLCDIRTVEVQRFVLQKFDNGLGWETCNHLRNLLSKIFANAKKWGHFAGTNPAFGVELPEKRQVQEKRVLMPEQVVRLLGVLREPVRTMVFLAVLTGLRVGEILALRWQDVDLDAGVRVVQAVYRGCLGSPKTKGSRRTVPLPQAVDCVAQKAGARCHSGRVGFSIPERHGPQRHKLTPAGLKACRKTYRSALGKLAYLPAYPRHAAAIGGRLGEGCASATRSFADHNHARNLHVSGSRPSTGGGRETLGNGDEW